MIKAAGIMFLTDAGETLLLKRGPGGDWPGAWCFPGGHQEDDETTEQAAKRECVEELGFLPDGERRVWTRRISENEAPIPSENINPQPAIGESVDYTTFIQHVKDRFDPELNGEHTAFAWCKVSTPPEPLHPGVKISLARLGMDELDVAQAIRDGKLVSPQQFENVTLFAMRITGTGVAYRHKLKEYVWRKPELYLNQHFLDRCNGLPVIWEHPNAGKLDTEEFADRVIGTIVLPYIKGAEVWGIAKIYDEDAARAMESKQLSTSPAVVFRKSDGNQQAKMEDGSLLLVEGKPSLLDHLAICEEGVWDKGRNPAGVELPTTVEHIEELKMPEIEKEVPGAEKRVDSEAGGGNLDRLLKGIDALCGRIDSMEKRMDSMSKHRMDDDENEESEEMPGEPKEVAADKRHRKDDDDDARKHRKDARKHRMDDDDGEDDAKHRKDAKRARMDDDDDDDDAKRHNDDDDGEDDAKHRKDAKRARMDDDDDDDAKHRKDARKHRMDDDDDDDAKHRSDSATMNKHIAAEIRRLSASVANMPKSMSDSDYAAMADHQARADAVYGGFGERAPAPLQGESVNAYRVRLAKGVQKHSESWKGVSLRDLPANVLEIAEQRIYADAASAAKNPTDVPLGKLREIRRRDAADRMITEFVGEPNAWMGEFRTPPRSISKPFFRPRNGN